MLRDSAFLHLEPEMPAGALTESIQRSTLNLNRIPAVAEGAPLEMWLSGVPAFGATGVSD